MTITLSRDTLTPELRRIIAESKRPKAILGAGAKSVQHDLVEHLKTLQSRGNQRGWPEQRFFAGKPTSVRKNVGVASLTDHQAVITIADPRFVHLITGGEITAKRAGALAVPLTAEAAAANGKGSLRESMPGLVPVRTKKGTFLAMPTAAAKGGLLRFLFKLVKSVMTRPHPEMAPDPKKLSENARANMFKAAARLLKASHS